MTTPLTALIAVVTVGFLPAVGTMNGRSKPRWRLNDDRSNLGNKLSVHALSTDMTVPIFIATERFDPSDGEKWQKYIAWANIPGLVEVVSLDSLLCKHLVTDLCDEDWGHIVNEDFRLDYFYHLNYLKSRIQGVPRRNVLGLYRNPEAHVVVPPAQGDFAFMGYDLIDEQTQISALTNCGGFPDVFSNDELNQCGLIESFERASEVRRLLAESHPEEPHAKCEMYALWRLIEVYRD